VICCTDGLNDQRVLDKADRVGDEAVIRAQASPSRSTATCRSRKRKIDRVAFSGDNSDKENMPLSHGCPAPATKRICREKTGTEWQSVLDIVKFSEEQEGRKQNEVVTEEGKQ
jgi:hypothetical protein